MTLFEYLTAMGILSCNRNPYLPSLEDLGFTWGEMTVLLDKKELFYCKVYRKRTVYLSPRAYFLLRQCRQRPALAGETAALYELLDQTGPIEIADLKRLACLDAKTFQHAFDFLLQNLYVTALENGKVRNPNWSTFRYGTAEQWEKLAAQQQPSIDPEGELRELWGQTMTKQEISRLISGIRTDLK